MIFHIDKSELNSVENIQGQNIRNLYLNESHIIHRNGNIVKTNAHLLASEREGQGEKECVTERNRECQRVRDSTRESDSGRERDSESRRESE